LDQPSTSEVTNAYHQTRRILITLVKQPDGKIRVTINRGEMEAYTKDAILAWLADDRATHTDYIAILDTIKADIDPL
jgi:hypothetical protein